MLNLSPGGDGTETITVLTTLDQREKGAVRNPAASQASLASGKGSATPTLEPELNKWEL